MDDTQLEAIWCVDSESGDEVLIELKTSKILARRYGNVIVEAKE